MECGNKSSIIVRNSLDPNIEYLLVKRVRN